MGKDHLDDKIKSRLQSHEEFIDKNELWAAIQVDKKKRGIPVFWWMFGLIGICLVSGLVWSNLSDTKAPPSNLITEEISDINNGMNDENYTASVNSIDNPIENTIQQEGSIITEVDDTPTSSTSVIKTQELNQFTNNNKSTLSNQTPDNQIDFIKRSNSLDATISTEEVKPLIAQSSQNLSNKEIQKDQDEDQSDHLNISTQEAVSGSVISEEIDANLTTIPLLNKAFNLIPVAINNKIDITLSIQLDDKPILEPIKQNKLALDLSFGGGLSHRNFTTTQDSPYDMRSSNESSLEFLNTSIGMRYNFNKNWYGKIGLDYSRYTERFKFNVMDEIVKQDTVPTLIAIDLKGDSMITSGSVEGTQLITTTWEYYNYYHSINVPIKIGYHIPINKWGLMVEAGPVINLGFYQDINVIDEKGVVTKNPNTYKSNIGFGLETSLGVTYNINKSISIYAAPSFKYNFSNTLSSSRYGSHKLSSIYLKLGGYINI